ncbi:hypothetical protein H257_05235 [Aphanomyces astaci]|uniref:Tc1-like transposase DDE domain-containing protein n=1 Tax=Aphanomyces astaci TaxID=112090 RepID=W4GSH9_APHAT|nr:hypothetical protein H257_05235 [Aphanomyces astaci]ETV82665.1 hypothetical protein H257_05235 [Aphanomyces astaci]|eukprot:XP_009828334.1 hypothetical protein H257_05235 [Aphanomyces astaci]
MAIKAVPHEGRQTLRSTAALSGIPKTTILRHMKEPHGLASRTSQLKPLLTDDNMLERLRFANGYGSQSVSFSLGYEETTPSSTCMWFFITKVKRRFYLYDEEMAERAAKSKKFITKVMFLAAVACPRYDGKIGIWPFVEEVAAVRSSKNRPKGTLELTTQSVNADVYQDMVMNEVVPAIQVKMPRGVVVKLQQDNASPHRCVMTELIARHGVDSIEVANQPPNSPDFNVLDLGFFNSIQSLQQQKVARSIGELIAAVEEAFYELPVTILGKTFITLQKLWMKPKVVTKPYVGPERPGGRLRKRGRTRARI